MEVSIIILNYNTFSLTSKCIESIYKQTKGIEFEIILVDNASTECDPHKFLELFPDIKLVVNRENRGFAGGCNDGIAQAAGDYILLLNSDTVLLNDAISIASFFLRDHPNVGVVACRLENIDGTPQHNCQAFPSIKLALIELFRLHKLLSKGKRGKLLWGSWFDYQEEAYPDWVWGTFFMFPRRVLSHLPGGRLPETFWMYIEDMEWCWLIRKAGYEVAFIPQGRVLHYMGNAGPRANAHKIIDNNYRTFLYLYHGPIYARLSWTLIRILRLGSSFISRR